MDTLFTEITNSEATSVVGGKSSPQFLSLFAPFYGVSATSKASAGASTVFTDTGYPVTYTQAKTMQDDFSSSSTADSISGVFYDDSILPG